MRTNEIKLTAEQQLADYCVSCDQRKHSAAQNPDGLCDDCNGGIYVRQNKKAVKK
jgi:hypothetical protein